MRRLQGVPNDSLVWMKMAAPHNATGNNFTLLVNFPDKVNESCNEDEIRNEIMNQFGTTCIIVKNKQPNFLDVYAIFI